MPDYNRGWKNASSYNPFSQKLNQREFRKVVNRSFLKRRAGGFFGGLWRLVRWFFGKRGFWKKIILFASAMVLLGFIAVGSLFLYYSYNLPDPNKLANREVAQSTKILDRNGKLLYEIYGEAKRTLIPFDEMPQTIKQATIAVEDKNFYNHGGVDLKGIARSIFVDVMSHSLSQGGSTITQQFVRNAVLTREKAFTRKIKEAIISLQLERKYSKDEILQLYLNEIPYGSNAYGIEAASETFFGKKATDLDLTQSAYLAAMPQAPTYYSPYGPHRKELDSRAHTVLQLMYEQGYITKTQRDQAQNEKVDFRPVGTGILAPHFVLYVQDLLAQKYGEASLQEGGFKVTTTLDLDLQTKAEAAVAKQIPVNETKYGANNASLVAIDPKNGQILAMVGSRDYFDKEHDGAINMALSPRQPGSSFKPYVYATAFKQGMSPATLLFDVVTNFGQFGGQDYVPQDYDGGQRGPVSIRKALQGSLNIPAVKTMLLVGVNNAIDTAESLGITTLTDRSRYGPSLVLGGGEIPLLEHTAAFGVFADGGIKHDTVPILKVEDNNGRVLEEYHDSQGREVLDPQVAYQINNVLSDNDSRIYIFGAGNKLTLPGRPVAAKTGTTQEYHDAWTVGYTPSLVTGVWVGNSDYSTMKSKADGSVVAAPIWNDFMQAALDGKPVEEFSRPGGITEVQVDNLSGKLPTIYTPATKTEIFASFNIPTQSDDVHIPITINGQTQVYTILHSEKPQDQAWEAPVVNWAVANGFSYPLGTNPGNTTTVDPNVKINVTAPDKITNLPWQITAQAAAQDGVNSIKIILDGSVLAVENSNSINYQGSSPRADGVHSLTVEATTVSGKINHAYRTIEFALGQSLKVLSPQDNQILNFPANIVIESSQDIAAPNVQFTARSSTGQKITVLGEITKKQTGPSIFAYTMNWAAATKPPAGSYSISAQIGNKTSDEVVVKIQ